MPQRVIDVFETVEVRSKEEHRFSSAPRENLLLLAQDEKPAPIGYVRELIFKRKGPESYDETLPVYGVADRSEQDVGGYLSFDEEILGAGLNGLCSDVVVIDPRHDDDRRARSTGAQGDQHVEARAVFEREIEKDEVKPSFIDPSEPGVQFVDLLHVHSPGSVAKGSANQLGITDVVFDE